MRTETRLIEFFGTAVEVRCGACDAEDIDFFFAPHVTTTGSATPAYIVELTAPRGFLRSLLAKDDAEKTFRVYSANDGVLIEERTFTRWSAVPSPLPPFRLLRGEIGVIQATVVACNGLCLALSGKPHSGKTSLGLQLAARGWTLVSDQLLVVQRRTGLVCPYLAPLGVRGQTLAALRDGVLAQVACRATHSPVSGQVLLARPESLAPVIPVGARIPDPHVVTVRRGAGTTHIEPTDLHPGAWPSDAWPWLRRALATDKPLSLLRLPVHGGELRAAEMIEEFFDG